MIERQVHEGLYINGPSLPKEQINPNIEEIEDKFMIPSILKIKNKLIHSFELRS